MFQGIRNKLSWLIVLATAICGLYPVCLLANEHPFVALFVAWISCFTIYLKKQI